MLVVTHRRCPQSNRYKRPLRSQRCCIDKRCHSVSAQGSLWTYWLRCHSKFPCWTRCRRQWKFHPSNSWPELWTFHGGTQSCSFGSKSSENGGGNPGPQCTNIGCRKHVVLHGTVKTCRSRTRELLTEIRRCSSSRAGRDTLSAVQVRPGFASMNEDGLQSNTGCLMRATQLSRKSSNSKKMFCSEGQVSVACQDGLRPGSPRHKAEKA